MPRSDQRLLKRILRIVKPAEHAIAVHVQLVPFGVDELSFLEARGGALRL